MASVGSTHTEGDGVRAEPCVLHVFVNYRREDTRSAAERLYESLSHEFGEDNVFMDVDALEPGADFVDAINERVRKCHVMLAVIGPRWLTVTDERGRRRLDAPDDFVRLEIETALRRGIRVIPVMVDGAEMPRADELPGTCEQLARRHGVYISESHWRSDVRGLVAALRKIAPPPEEVTAPSPARRRPSVRMGRGARLVAAAVAAAVAVAVLSAGTHELLMGSSDEMPARSAPSKRTAVVASSAGGGSQGAGQAGAPKSLLARVVPSAMLSLCRQLPEPVAGAAESVTCSRPGEPNGKWPASSWTLSAFRTTAPLLAYYQRVVREHGLGPGPCTAGSWDGTGPWVHSPEKPGGRRACFRTGATLHVVWTHEKLGQASHVDFLVTADADVVWAPEFAVWMKFWRQRMGKLLTD